jgi:hypothetical protein
VISDIRLVVGFKIYHSELTIERVNFVVKLSGSKRQKTDNSLIFASK